MLLLIIVVINFKCPVVYSAKSTLHLCEDDDDDDDYDDDDDVCSLSSRCDRCLACHSFFDRNHLGLGEALSVYLHILQNTIFTLLIFLTVICN